MSENIRKKIEAYYGGRIRIRACGCLLMDKKLLMLKHQGIGALNYFWNVPGGEPEKGEGLREAVEREFFEETGMRVRCGNLLTVHEFIQKPLHALEFYFEVKHVHGNALLGEDPEAVHTLAELAWFSKEEFRIINPLAKPTFLTKDLDFD
ncbi:NUDIX hydrolase [Marinilongibacter aquaticus]|uniref:NUDIX domain-containing protein n=1 Tax=Marinilongibacter aquaticus TaxID=2975157 RepID=UPI0021BD1337|nr:NUDIX hydrolase [Marinilongibacter aquaticus]UBM59007.1 NUDIX hydrolase [Marinilongibacter aquaticus]